MADSFGEVRAAAAAGPKACNNGNSNSNSSGQHFKCTSAPGQLEKLGLTPIRKVHAADRFKKRLTALDRHRSLVTRIERSNRRRSLVATQQQQAAAEKQAVVATFTQRLRSAILDGQDLEGTWQPVSTAAATMRRQEEIAQQHQEQEDKLAEEAKAKFLTTGLWLKEPPGVGSDTTAAATTTASSSSHLQAEAEDFINTLLATAAAGAAAAGVAAAANTTEQQQQQQQQQQQAGASSQGCGSGSGSSSSLEQTSRPGTSSGKAAVKPAWALSSSEADAAAAAEEADLLSFAAGLDWDAFVATADDAELAAALQALQDAEQKRAKAKGDTGAEKAWTKSFVTAVNHLVLKKASAAAADAATAAASNGVSPAGAGASPGDDAAGDQDDVRSMVSRLTALSKAHSAASKSVRGDQQSPAAAGAGGASDWDGSVKDPTETAATAAAVAGTKAAEAFLWENRDMKGVHSLSSVRALLQRMQVSAAAAAAAAGGSSK